MNKNRAMAILLGLVLLSGSNSMAATLTGSDVLKSPQIILEENAGDARSFIKSMLARARQLKSYIVDTELCTYKGNKRIVETGKLMYKNPNLIRFECINAGKRSGAVVVRQADGKIKGKMGGALSGIKLTLSPDSKLLKTANDFSILECDLASLLSMTDKAAENAKCKVGVLPGSSSQIIELSDNNGVLVSRILVDLRSKLPEDWSLFKDNSIFSTARFQNFELLADLPDSTFNLAPLGRGIDQPVLIANERGGDLSPADYKLRVETMKRQDKSEYLAEELGLFAGTCGAVAPNPVVRDASVMMIVTNSSAISAINLAADAWPPGSKEQLVSAASQIELLLTALDRVATCNRTAEQAACWQESIASCRKKVAALMDFADNDKVDPAEFEALKMALRQSSGALLSLP